MMRMAETLYSALEDALADHEKLFSQGMPKVNTSDLKRVNDHIGIVRSVSNHYLQETSQWPQEKVKIALHPTLDIPVFADWGFIGNQECLELLRASTSDKMFSGASEYVRRGASVHK